MGTFPLCSRFALAAALLICAVDAAAAIPQSERDALLALYKNAGGSGWVSSTGWNGAAGTECQWFGVSCDETGSTVTAIHLGQNNLVGTLPLLGALSNLQDFEVYDNQLGGTIPPISTLKSLQIFVVAGNQLTGTIPAIDGMTALLTLDVYNNQLTGTLPTALPTLTQLQYFGAKSNQLTGTIPAIAGMTALQYFDVSHNQLTGTIPSLTNLPSLQYLDMGDNQLTGQIPPLNLPSLQGFSFELNQLTGPLPSLDNLPPTFAYLNVQYNQLSGHLPSLARFTGLTDFAVAANNFDGPIPPLTGLTKLQSFEVLHNKLSGPIPSLAGLVALQNLDVSDNQLSGPLPPLDGLGALQYLVLYDNQLSGPMPSFAGLTNLVGVYAGDNQFTALPPSLTGLTQLTAFYVDSNRLSGPIPAIDGSPQLQYFSVANNQLTGSVPALTGLSQLIGFDVSFNQLSGPIPALGGLTNLQTAYLDFNQLSGPIPALTGLTSLREFVVLDNQLSGTIPPLAGLANLQAFNAEGNQLSGALPALSGLTNLWYFSVAQNQLSGPLPQLSGLSSLNTFDVSFNGLTGPIPALAQLPGLQYLYLDVNELSGALPSLSGVASLVVFDAGHNHLSGTIPSLGTLADLQQFDVDSNELSGTLPSLSGLSNLQYFQVGGNFLSGAIPAVPNPDNLVGGLSSLCPNSLTPTPDAQWDDAVGNSPWYSTCTATESKNANDAPTAKDSTHIALSGDGSIKVFQSQETTLVPGNQNAGGQDVYSIGPDGVPVLEDIDESGHQMIGTASLPAISGDGKVVAFAFVPAGMFSASIGAGQIYAGLQGAPKHRVDTPGGTPPPDLSAVGAPSVSSVNGKYQIAFCSSSATLVPGDTNQARDVFLADPLNAASAVQRISLDGNGNEIPGDSCEPQLSGNGANVVFSVSAPTLFGTPTRQIVLKPLVSGTGFSAPTTLASTTGQLKLVTAAMGTPTHGANADSTQPTVSADGSVVAFTSQASDLDALGTPAGGHEVFVALGNGGLARARSGDGIVPNGGSQQPQLSADGTTVVVQTDATNWQGGTLGQCGAVALNTNFFALAAMGSTLCTSSGSTLNQNPAISADGVVTGFDSNAKQANGATNSNTYAQSLGSYTGLTGAPIANLSGDFSGQWFNPDQNGHGLVIDVTNPDAANHRLLVLTWFVYLNGRPTWVQGVGVPVAGSGSAANTVVVPIDQVGIFKGVSFPLGAAHASASLWGSITLTFTDANTGTLAWKSTYPGFGSGKMPIKHFLAVGLPAQDAPGAQVRSCYSGNWFNPAQSGHGFEFEVLPGPALAADWFAYAPDGSPVWLSGAGPISGNTAQLHMAIFDGAGAQFPPAFDSGQLTAHDWGTATVTFTDATHAQVSWNSTIAGYGSGTQPLQPIAKGLLDRRSCN